VIAILSARRREHGHVADGIDLPYYVVDDRTSAWRHVAVLAGEALHATSPPTGS